MFSQPIRDCPELTSGERVNGWYVEKLLGQGGFACVFKVTKKIKNRKLIGALKICSINSAAKTSATTKSEAWRINQEVEILERVQGRFAPELYDEGTHNGIPYFVMEYLTPVKPSKMPSTDDEITKLMLDLTEALEELHKLDWVHCDVKPHNIARRADGQYVLIDFGAAHKMDPKHVTRHQMLECSLNYEGGIYGVAGTKYYQPPEVCFRPYRDIYALGHVLRDCFKEDVPFEWSMIINKCISWRADYRYPDMESLRQDIINLPKIRRDVYWGLRVKRIQDSRVDERLLLTATPRNVSWAEILTIDKTRSTETLKVLKVRLAKHEGKACRYTVTEPLKLEENTVLLISGKGVLKADISGPSSSIVVVRDHASFNNLNANCPPKNNLLYAIIGPGGYLNLANIKEKDRSKFFADGKRRIFRDIDAATAFRFGGPDTFAEIELASTEGLKKTNLPEAYRNQLLKFFQGEKFTVFPPRQKEK